PDQPAPAALPADRRGPLSRPRRPFLRDGDFRAVAAQHSVGAGRARPAAFGTAGRVIASRGGTAGTSRRASTGSCELDFFSLAGWSLDGACPVAYSARLRMVGPVAQPPTLLADPGPGAPRTDGRCPRGVRAAESRPSAFGLTRALA